jgi:hypothetical protein
VHWHDSGSRRPPEPLAVPERRLSHASRGSRAPVAAS